MRRLRETETRSATCGVRSASPPHGVGGAVVLQPRAMAVVETERLATSGSAEARQSHKKQLGDRKQRFVGVSQSLFWVPCTSRLGTNGLLGRTNATARRTPPRKPKVFLPGKIPGGLFPRPPRRRAVGAKGLISHGFVMITRRRADGETCRDRPAVHPTRQAGSDDSGKTLNADSLTVRLGQIVSYRRRGADLHGRRLPCGAGH